MEKTQQKTLRIPQKTENKTVAIGVLSYNRPEGIKQTLGYLSEQPYKNIKVLISDNGSCNNVRNIIKEHCSKDSRFHYCFQQTNIGPENNFRFVKERFATAEYFMWMSDDDRFDEDYIKKCVGFLDNNADFIMCSGTGKIFDNEKLLFYEDSTTLKYHSGRDRLFKYLAIVFKNSVIYGVQRNNHYNIENHAGSDWSFVGNLALSGKIKVLDDVFFIKDNNGGSSTRKKITDKWGATGMKKLFFETYTAWQISRHLRTDFITKSISFVFLNCKFLYNSIRRRIVKKYPK